MSGQPPGGTASAGSENDSFHGRTALVTGGGRGLGLAMATALARRGADIALFDIQP